MSSPVVGWSDAKWRAWIVSLLRRGSTRFPNRFNALKQAKRGKKINKATGRIAEHYECSICKEEYPAKQVVIDHIEPVVCPIQGFISWDVYIERMFCKEDNYQCICKPCHKIKSEEERKQRRRQ